MPKAAKPRRAAPRPGAGGPPPLSVPRARLLGVLAVLLALGALAYVALRPHLPPKGADVPPDLDAAAARDDLIAGVQLSQADHHARAVPLLRRALGGMPREWMAHYDLAMALANSSFEVRTSFARLDPVMRSSAERVAAMRESELELGIALSLATAPRDRAVILVSGAQNDEHWGLWADARMRLRAAIAADPAWEQARRLERELGGQLAAEGGK